MISQNRTVTQSFLFLP